MSMDGRAVQEHAMRVAAALPAVEHGYPFGPEHDVFKVAGKVFLMATQIARGPIVTMKCDPEESVALRAESAAIIPGYHMNKRHWISIVGGDGVSADLVEELATDSYLLVVRALPRSRRPVLPDHLRRPPAR